MKTVALIVMYVVLITNNQVRCQDKISFVNGELLSGKLLKQSASSLTISEDGIEKEINSFLVSKVTLASGKELEFTTPFTLGMTYDANFAVVESTSHLEEDISRTFKNAVRREFKVDVDNSNGDFSTTLFLSAVRNPSLNKKQNDAIGYFRFLGYSCNAFFATVAVEGDVCKYIFYSNRVQAETIKNYIINRSFILVDSKASNSLRNLIDNTIKTFTMKFLADGKCIFSEGDTEKMLNYEIYDNGSISFWDQGKKKEKGTTYEIVSIGDTFMRYTLFEPGNKNLITRKVQVVDRL